MDWYIFLTPLLLLPIIFLFRLVGCGYPDFQYDTPPEENGTTERPLINITFILNIVDPIPPIPPNPIIYIWPKFRVDDGGSGPSIQYLSNPISLGQTAPPFTFISVPTQVPAGNHTCSCDLFMLRLDMDVTTDNSEQIIDSINDNPDQAVGQHLTGPAIVDPQEGFVAETEITFNLHYNQSDPDQTDYSLDDFSFDFSLVPEPP
jgi:hypothetical protein